MEEKLSSKVFYIMKCLAIISVATAHTKIGNEGIDAIFSVIGLIGVPMFLIISGIYFNYDIKTSDFILKKLKNLVVPILISGGLTYIYRYKGSGLICFTGYIKWITGYNTWLYFANVLLICMILVKLFHNKLGYIVYFVLFIISNILTINNMMDYTIITKYQNPFNWIGFFVLGVLLNKVDIKKHIPRKNEFLLFLSITMFLIFTLAYTKIFSDISYWNSLSIIYELSMCIAIYYICFYLVDLDLLIDVGKNTYFLFFYHMQVGSTICEKIFKNMYVLWPILNILSLYILLTTGKYICKKIHLYKYLWILGIQSK